MNERPLTGRMRADGAMVDLAAYEAAGGYRAARDAVRGRSPGDVQQVVADAGLRGRGGAGFPTGKKWGFVPMGDDAPRPKYLVANADEMEPGTFKDRWLLEGDPHQLLEGLILTGWAVQADVAWIFLRWAYRLAAERLERAIAEARDRGYLGEDVFGSGWSLDVRLHVSAGRYICGEETALLNALEGRRALPREKPPFPPVVGLWGKPTIVQNVETLCCVPHIAARGAEWFRGLGRGEGAGTKLYGASGRVRRPGAWELPIGTPLGEVLEEHAGGMREGYRFRGVLPGGASTDFLVEEHLEVPLDFDPVSEAGSRLGTGSLVVLDDRTCPVAFVHNLEQFFAHESCGWCTPCREGVPWLKRILASIEAGAGTPRDLELLEEVSGMLGPGRTFCAFAPGAVEPLQSGLRFFRDDFERHVGGGRCPFESATGAAS